MLLLVDVQRNMLEPPTPVPDAEIVSAALATLLDRARAADLRERGERALGRRSGDRGAGRRHVPGVTF
ncbi:hypothetical protein [Nonomuraea sp. LPB2021202275-12-8]|uniref:hypothetical protein n=1 Tax=Nonomuraea sp. LPB2021202275-12-8 TaxID=3120159 RepID=UPI00300C0689